jgi:tRNA nucleotidyltransferase/poly(A) polymerase
MVDIVDEQLARIAEWRAPAFQELLDALLVERATVYVVGGVVRDYLLGKGNSLTDLDIVLEKPIQSLAQQIADKIGWAYYPLDRDRDVARLVRVGNGQERLECDLAGLRGDLEEDLRSRDFTVNSLALALSPDQPPQLVDLTGGVEDLRRRRLRMAEEINLDHDPVRMLRAVRLSHKMGLEIVPDIREQIRKRATAIETASAERVRDELWKMLTLATPSEVVETAKDLGMLPYVYPELAGAIAVEQSPPHHLDVYEHTLLVMDYAAGLRDWLLGEEDAALEPDILEVLSNWQQELRAHFAEPLNSGHTRAHWLVWHALFHDVGKPATRTEEITEEGEIRYRFFDHEAVSADMTEDRLQDLRFSRREVVLATSVVAAHMRAHNLHASFKGKRISRRAAYRFLRDTASGATGERTGVDVILLALVDRQAIGLERGAQWRAFLDHMDQLLDFAFRPLPGTSEPLLDGEQLIAAFNLEPGRLIGHLLARIQEAQATGEITSAAEAMVLVARLLENDLVDDAE